MLIQNLRDNDSQVRCDAAELLGSIGDPSAVESLVEALIGIDTVRIPVARALGRIGDSRAVAPLVDLLHKSRTDAVIVAIVEALRKIGTPEALAAIEAWERERRARGG